ncbi:MAG: ATP-binding cassette domain-containing protein [Solobacterium sp.]|nr:ATP-binding cassette domain-containing protein [Solobacterium sp.]MBR3345671.1 ATP-binding cassette domain-containing protein [Solobacterium sp.]
MGIYSEVIRQKEINNHILESFADEALLNDESVRRVESEVDDVQSALLFILGKFGISASRLYGYRSTEDLLEAMLDPYGMMYYKADNVTDEIRDHTEYILAFRQDGKAVALHPSFHGYRWYCPHDNKRGAATNDYCHSLKPQCFVFNQPIREFGSVTFTFIYNVLKYMTVYDVIYLLLATAAVTGLGLIFPYINKWVYNTFLKDPDSNLYLLRVFFALYLGLSVVKGFISILKSKLLSDLRNRVSIRIQAAVMAKVLHLPRSFFSDNSSGKVSKRITYCNNLSSMIINIFLDILLNFSFSGVYLIQMRSFSKDLFMPALVFIGVKICVSVISAIGNSVIERKTMALDMERNSFFASSIRGIQKIKSMGSEKSIYAKWADQYRKSLHYSYNKPFFLKYKGELISALSTVATITLMGITFFRGITREDYMIFSSAYTNIITVASSVVSMMSNIFRMRTLADSVRPIFTTESDEKTNADFVRSITGNIRVENIYFSYDKEKRGCLRGVSLEIKEGEKIAIVGESGCGKSTLLKIIMGMEKPDQGSVFFDDKDLGMMNTRSLRQKIGSVFQFSKVFAGTIYDNVVFGSRTEHTDEEVWKALDLACIGDDIRKLPLGINTELSESNSSGFSGGQRQRILIARALINHPKLLVLDEATSALDNLTQKAVLEHINALKCTVVMVAHRLSTVKNFDRIIMLENGEIAEEGTFDALMAKNGKFAQLVQKQLIQEEKDVKDIEHLDA